MSSRLRWIVLLIIVAGVLAWGASRWRQGAGTAAAPVVAAASAPAQPRLELAAGDLLSLRRVELAQGVAVTGQLKAVQTALLKAKVAGELQLLSVREGDTVRAGQVLGQIDPTELDWRLRQAQQQAEASQAQVDVAERTLANNRALVTQGFISATALDTATANANGARASLQAAQSAVELARKARADAQLIAPISGLVSQRLAQPGERLAVDGRVLEIVDLSRLELEAAVPPQEVTRLQVGASATLRVDGLDQALRARVVRINPSATAGARTVSAYLALDAHPALRQGLFAQGRVEVGRQSALAVPSSAVRLDQPLPYLLVLEGDTARQHTVRTGATGEVDGVTMTEILAGATEGDSVLAAQAGAVQSGTRVRRPAAGGAAASSAASGAQPSAGASAPR